MLEVKNLVVKIDDKIILNGMNFKVKKGEVHAIMGPNGSGKSTLSKVIAGHPSYQVVEGEILFEINGKMTNIIPIDPYERAREGIFLSFQYPVEVPGVTNTTFLKEAFNSICKHQGADELDPYDFGQLINAKNEILNMNSSFLDRGINEGFSGGEKKKNEILQMLLLNPRLSLLDEIDSGLDVDALKIVSKGINTYRNKHNAVVMVTHYQRLLDFVVPDFVHILNNGRIVKSGGRELALEVEAKGYDWVQN